MALLAYAIFRRDPVIITGQGMGLFVYTRNLMLVDKARARRSSMSPWIDKQRFVLQVDRHTDMSEI